jgi:N-acetylglucosaminyl-diphospho-decaprenol L-rhamnosyltransferase
MTTPLGNAVSVVVVTYESATTITRCLDRIRDSDLHAEIIVVDNASQDGTADIVRGSGGIDRDRQCPAPAAGAQLCTTLLTNADNRGFARACNQGAVAAHGDYIVFLNPDAFVGGDTIGRLERHLRNDPRIGLIGCVVVDESGRPHGPQRRREPTSWRSLMSSTGLARLERFWPVLEGVERQVDSVPQVESGHRSKIEDVDAVNGALMMMPRDMFERIGGFDEEFTLHAEDLDLCRRVRDAGSRVVMAQDVEVVHVGGVSSRRRPFWVEWQKTRSLWRYFRKHDKSARSHIVSALVATGLALRLAVRLPILLCTRLPIRPDVRH